MVSPESLGTQGLLPSSIPTSRPQMDDQASASKFTVQTARWRTEWKKLHFLSSQRLHIILLFTSYWPEIICIIMLAREDKNLYFIPGSLQVAMFPVKNNGFYDVNIQLGKNSC